LHTLETKPNPLVQKKLGEVMWGRTQFGNMVPLEVFNRISPDEERRYQHVYECATMYRKMTPVLRTIVRVNWEDRKTMKRILEETFRSRSGAREMRATGDWEAFWSSL
jgi:hypothetical protein